MRGVNNNSELEFCQHANNARRWQDVPNRAGRDGELRSVRILVQMLDEGFKPGQPVISADTEAYWRERYAALQATVHRS